MSNKDKRYLNLALQVAEESVATHRHGCVIVKSGKVLALGANRDTNHPSVLSEEHVKGGASIHAEVRALKKLSDARGAVLYVARLTEGGRVGYSKPCVRCQKVIDTAGVKRIVYT